MFTASYTAFPKACSQQSSRERTDCSPVHTRLFPRFDHSNSTANATVVHRFIHGFSEGFRTAFPGVMHYAPTVLSTAGSGCFPSCFPQPVHSVFNSFSRHGLVGAFPVCLIPLMKIAVRIPRCAMHQSSSCPGLLSRASTSCQCRSKKDVDGRDLQREDALRAAMTNKWVN